MYYTVPGGPLSGSSTIAPDRITQSKQYPFLEYCSQYWSEHMLKAVTTFETQKVAAQVGPLQQLLELSKLFLQSKSIVTTWIEASWMFGRNPTIINAEKQMHEISLLTKLLDNEDRLACAFRGSMQSLGQLSEDLNRLNKAWGKVLQQTPNEIWEPSISGFMKSKFWVTVEGSKLTPLESGKSDEQSFFCVKSQVSADETKVGIVKVQPPDASSMNLISSKHSANGLYLLESSDEPIWRVRYELWSLESKSMIMCESFQVPTSMVPFSYMYKDNGTDDHIQTLEFLFPTSLSSNLRHASFLNIVGSIVRDTYHSTATQTPDLKSKPEMVRSVLDISLKTDPALCGTFNFDWSKFHTGFSTHMSESGEFLLVLHMLPGENHGQILNVDDITQMKLWFVRIYRNSNFDSGLGPTYSLISTIAFIPDRISRIKDRPFTFHPTLPLLSFVSGRTAWIERRDKHFGYSILTIGSSKLEVPGESVHLKNSLTFQKPAKGSLSVIWYFGCKGSI